MRNWEVLISIKFHERYSNWFIFYVPTFRVSLSVEMRGMNTTKYSKALRQRDARRGTGKYFFEEKQFCLGYQVFSKFSPNHLDREGENLENCIFFISAFSCLDI